MKKAAKLFQFSSNTTVVFPTVYVAIATIPMYLVLLLLVGRSVRQRAMGLDLYSRSFVSGHIIMYV